MYRYALRLTGSEHAAEELAAETFYRAMVALPDFRGECAASTWLCQIARNTWTSLRRKEGRCQPLDDTAALPDSRDFAAAFEDKDLALRIHRLLGRTIVLVTHDIDEALRLADHLVLMDGGEVVQQGAPLEMLLRPKNSFVQTFFGRSELGVRLLSLREVGDYLRPDERLAGEGLTVTMTLREALSQFVARRCEALPVVDAEGQPCGTLHFADLLRQEMSHEGAS